MSDYSNNHDLLTDGHVTLSDSPRVPLPDRFTAPDNATFCPQSFGGSANPDDDDDATTGGRGGESDNG